MVIRAIWWFLILAAGVLTYLLATYVIGFSTDKSCTECGEGTWLSVYLLLPFAVAIVVFSCVSATRIFRFERALAMLVLLVALSSLLAFVTHGGRVT